MNAHIGYSILSDVDINRLLQTGDLKITTPPEETKVRFSKDQISVGSIDLHFKREYNKFTLKEGDFLRFEDTANRDYLSTHRIGANNRLVIGPHEVIVTSTLEYISLSAGIAGFVAGRTSISTLGIMVNSGSEYINPGHSNSIPLQLVNLTPFSIQLDMATPIGQLVLFGLNTPASRPYSELKDAKYAKVDPDESLIWQESRSPSFGRRPKPRAKGTIKVYIASKYIEHKDINEKIQKKLKDAKINCFLPATINIDAVTEEEKLQVAETCYTQIEDCNVIIAIEPYGRDVAAEIAYAIALQNQGRNIRIIRFGKAEKPGAMLDPYFDHVIDPDGSRGESDYDDLISLIIQLKKELRDN